MRTFIIAEIEPTEQHTNVRNKATQDTPSIFQFFNSNCISRILYMRINWLISPKSITVL